MKRRGSKIGWLFKQDLAQPNHRDFGAGVTAPAHVEQFMREMFHVEHFCVKQFLKECYTWNNSLEKTRQQNWLAFQTRFGAARSS
ncbi:hypothetical protein [Ruminococcus sp. YE78]|uniref:hypothetical protein n=1 Tax=Ruminococcus sp. YE78 TaxID=1352374 RepID=UPI00111439EB|nr:hypothetical protein [Ruminococcus sp. YE78]